MAITATQFLYFYTVFLFFYVYLVTLGAPTFMPESAQNELSALTPPQAPSEISEYECVRTNVWTGLEGQCLGLGHDDCLKCNCDWGLICRPHYINTTGHECVDFPDQASCEACPRCKWIQPTVGIVDVIRNFLQTIWYGMKTFYVLMKFSSTVFWVTMVIIIPFLFVLLYILIPFIGGK